MRICIPILKLCDLPVPENLQYFHANGEALCSVQRKLLIYVANDALTCLVTTLSVSIDAGQIGDSVTKISFYRWGFSKFGAQLRGKTGGSPKVCRSGGRRFFGGAADSSDRIWQHRATLRRFTYESDRTYQLCAIRI